MKKPSDRNDGRSTEANGVGGPRVFELDPEQHPAYWESLVDTIMVRAASILEARRQQTLAGTLSGWRRPVFAGAAGLAAAAVAVLVLLPGQNSGPGEVSLAEVVMPWSVAAWIDGGEAPSAIDLVDAVEEYVP